MHGTDVIDSPNIHNSDDDAEDFDESDSDDEVEYEDDDFEQSPLGIACDSGDEDTVKRLLLAGGVDVEKRYIGFTALLGAVDSGQTKIVELLLAHGADSSAVESRGFSSIMIAAQKGNTSILRSLLEHNPVTTKKMINMTNKHKISALEFAAGNDRVDVAHMLLKHGADVNQEDPRGRNAMLVAIICGGSAAFVKVMIENGVNVHHEDNFGDNAMKAAFFQENLEIIKLLMDAGVSLDKSNKKGVSLAHCVAKWGGNSMARFLVLNKAACLESKSMSGKTPCSTAELYGNYGVKMIFKDKITKDRGDAKRAKR